VSHALCCAFVSLTGGEPPPVTYMRVLRVGAVANFQQHRQSLRPAPHAPIPCHTRPHQPDILPTPSQRQKLPNTPTERWTRSRAWSPATPTTVRDRCIPPAVPHPANMHDRASHDQGRRLHHPGRRQRNLLPHLHSLRAPAAAPQTLFLLTQKHRRTPPRAPARRVPGSRARSTRVRASSGPASGEERLKVSLLD